MAGHCTVRFDVNLNYVPDKKNSLDKIDGIVAAVMGVGLAMNVEDDGMDGWASSCAASERASAAAVRFCIGAIGV